MSRKNHEILAVSVLLAAILALAGCGGGINTTTGNPSGFTNSSLNGTYSFAISGNNGGGFFAVAGSITADGNGHITGGTEDINSPGTGVLLTNVAVTGNYSVRSDGRAVATLNSTGLNPAISFGLDFVLLSNSKGLAIRFDSNGSASGTLDLQSSSAFNLASLAGAFALNISGINASGNPQSSVGLINTDSAGNITGGSLDDNNSLTLNLNLALSASTLTAPAGTNGRGTGSIISSLGTRNFAYYVVDANHLKVIETDGAGPFLAGDAFRQSSATVSGSFTFTVAGSTTAGHTVFVAGGVLNTDGVSNVLNTSIMDFDNGGVNVSPAGGSAATGVFSVTAGRGTLQLNTPTLTLNLVFYPSTGGLQMLDVDTTIVASGSALAQSGGPFSNASINNSYGLNFSGVTGAGSLNPVEIDAIAQFSSGGSGTFSGAMDVNDFGALSNSLTLNGNYTVSSNGRGTVALRTSLGTFNIVVYVANTSQVQFIEMDEANIGQLSAGVFSTQTAP